MSNGYTFQQSLNSRALYVMNVATVSGPICLYSDSSFFIAQLPVEFLSKRSLPLNQTRAVHPLPSQFALCSPLLPKPLILPPIILVVAGIMPSSLTNAAKGVGLLCATGKFDEDLD
jgi:hypothetical protein